MDTVSQAAITVRNAQKVRQLNKEADKTMQHFSERNTMPILRRDDMLIQMDGGRSYELSRDTKEWAK